MPTNNLGVVKFISLGTLSMFIIKKILALVNGCG